jgi:hypothetical protein
VLVVPHMNVRLYVNCRLMGTGKLRGRVSEVGLQWTKFRLGSSGDSAANRLPYRVTHSLFYRNVLANNICRDNAGKVAKEGREHATIQFPSMAVLTV